MKKILQANQKNPARHATQSDAGGEKVLRQNAEEVRITDIKTKKIKNILKEMSAALKSQEDGVAIAAPQIGYSLRIFVVSGKIFSAEIFREGSLSGAAAPALPLGSSACEKPRSGNSAEEDMIFINPKISKLSREKEWMPEGCLSVRWLYGKSFQV